MMSGTAKTTSKPRRNRVLFLGALAVIFAGLASVVLLANNAHNLDRLLAGFGFPPLTPPPPVQTDKPVVKPPGPVILVPEHMTDPPLIAPQDGFYRTITRRREDICSALQKSGWVSEEWQVADLGQQSWSCGAEKFVAAPDDPVTIIGSLFVSARGMGSDNVSSVRLKANFLDGQISPVVQEQAVSAARDILDAIGWGQEPEIVDKLRRWKQFEFKGNGNTISLSREPTDIPRYNFIIASEPPGLIRQQDAPGARKRWLKSPEPAD